MCFEGENVIQQISNAPTKHVGWQFALELAAFDTFLVQSPPFGEFFAADEFPARWVCWSWGYFHITHETTNPNQCQPYHVCGISSNPTYTQLVYHQRLANTFY